LIAYFAVTSFRDEEYRTELEGGDEYIEVSVTSPHKVPGSIPLAVLHLPSDTKKKSKKDIQYLAYSPPLRYRFFCSIVGT
jgi:hypothetical protein